MEENSKGAEVRARVTSDMLNELTAIAKGRGEQLPVVIREALNEYLARRVATAGTAQAVPGSDALRQILKDQPEVANALLALGRLLSSSPLSAADLADAHDRVHGVAEVEALQRPTNKKRAGERGKHKERRGAGTSPHGGQKPKPSHWA